LAGPPGLEVHAALCAGYFQLELLKLRLLAKENWVGIDGRVWASSAPASAHSLLHFR
jgi:hypothetical protein